MRNKNLKKILISFATVIGVLTLTGNNVNARARHYRYHYRTKYRIKRNRWHRSRRYRVRGKRFVWHAKRRRAKKRIRRPRKYRRYKKYYRKYRKGRKYRKKHTKKSTNKNKHSKQMSDKEFYKKMMDILDSMDDSANKDNNDESNDSNNNQKNANSNTSAHKPNDSKNIYNNNALYNTDNVYTGTIYNPDGSEEVINTPQKINDNETCADLQTLNELNADRKSVNEPELTWDPSLTAIAYKRAKQLESNFSHYDNSNHAYYMDEDARSLGLSPNVVQAENISHTSSTDTASSGKTESEVGPMAADDMNLGMFNGEKGSTPSQDGGHRVSIESPQDTSVGIGTVYNPNNFTYYMAEEFGGNLFNS